VLYIYAYRVYKLLRKSEVWRREEQSNRKTTERKTERTRIDEEETKRRGERRKRDEKVV
jgi:amino acid permease